jgi:hypothetical protein
MNLKSVVSIALLTMSGLGSVLLPVSYVRADEHEETATPQQIIRYECYDRSGNLAFTTADPAETIGWAMGCREVPYTLETRDEDDKLRITYYECYDGNGNIAFTTTNESLADSHSFECRNIGYRTTVPVEKRSVYYECLNNEGEIAFTTNRHQDTQGWVPNCREVRTLEVIPTANELPQ